MSSRKENSYEYYFGKQKIEKRKEESLGRLIIEMRDVKKHSNSSLAEAAGVSESAIRNLLKCGEELEAKDPDARTLHRVAKALDIDSTQLFRLAGYIPYEPARYSARAEYFAGLFDRMPQVKRDAIMGVFEAMAEKPNDKFAIQQMRENPDNPIAGLDINDPDVFRVLANKLINLYQMAEPSDVSRIENDLELLGYSWKEVGQAVQQRIKALIRYKLSLRYDPTMIDIEWRN